MIADRVHFDVELLFVRILELSGRHLGLVAADVIQAARVLPAEDEFFKRFLADAASEELKLLQFMMTLDFVLDERALSEYLALSYLRDDDPEVGDLLRGFPIPAPVRARLAAFFDEAQCAKRLAEGWASWTELEERSALDTWVRSRVPDFSPR